MYQKLRLEMPDLLQCWLKRGSIYKTLEEWVKIAEQLAAENGGILPNLKWLQNNYPGLASVLQKNRHLFQHIKQEWGGGKKPEEWVALAEKLAEENGGLLKNTGWLQANGYGGLAQIMSKHPELFAHIPYKKLRKNTNEWVKDAEQLAAENGGVLQNQKWLTANGYRSLISQYTKHPQLFRHIPRESDKRKKRPEEWVPIADRLAAQNGGILPCKEFLEPGLVFAIRKHPVLFQHIKQEWKGGKRPEEWVLIAEQLAVENGGVLKCVGWLQENHNALAQVMSKYPKLFAHIRQEWKGGKKPEEWVPVAEKLAKENGGVLPHHRWLYDNGYSGLTVFIKKYPSLFRHIKKTFKRDCIKFERYLRAAAGNNRSRRTQTR